jgi:hypothetical protein
MTSGPFKVVKAAWARWEQVCWRPIPTFTFFGTFALGGHLFLAQRWAHKALIAKHEDLETSHITLRHKYSRLLWDRARERGVWKVGVVVEKGVKEVEAEKERADDKGRRSDK